MAYTHEQINFILNLVGKTPITVQNYDKFAKTPHYIYGLKDHNQQLIRYPMNAKLICKLLKEKPAIDSMKSEYSVNGKQTSLIEMVQMLTNSKDYSVHILDSLFDKIGEHIIAYMPNQTASISNRRSLGASRWIPSALKQFIKDEQAFTISEVEPAEQIRKKNAEIIKNNNYYAIYNRFDDMHKCRNISLKSLDGRRELYIEKYQLDKLFELNIIKADIIPALSL